MYGAITFLLYKILEGGAGETSFKKFPPHNTYYFYFVIASSVAL